MSFCFSFSLLSLLSRFLSRYCSLALSRTHARSVPLSRTHTQEIRELQEERDWYVQKLEDIQAVTRQHHGCYSAKQVRAQSHRKKHTRRHTKTRAHTRTHTQTRTQIHTHIRTHTRTHTLRHALRHTHSHICQRTRICDHTPLYPQLRILYSGPSLQSRLYAGAGDYFGASFVYG